MTQQVPIRRIYTLHSLAPSSWVPEEGALLSRMLLHGMRTHAVLGGNLGAMFDHVKARRKRDLTTRLYVICHVK